MYMYLYESIHDRHGFIVLGFVVCQADPQQRLRSILKEFDQDEYHSLDRMDGNKIKQDLRSKMLEDVNHNCRWGVMVCPSADRKNLYKLLKSKLNTFVNNVLKPEDSVFIFLDEGIVAVKNISVFNEISQVSEVIVCKSHEVIGIQLADLVAALCGVRLKEKVSGNPKMLAYDRERGFEPPIEAELGYELWASLRYSMLHNPVPLGTDMPGLAEFETLGYGLYLSDHCSEELVRSAIDIFGRIYLGCIH